MPESACLHIQARDADPIRVVEIPGTSVRIGRAAYCEVRLSEPEVADEECLLRRRGGTWHLVPIGHSGLVKIDDDPVESPRPLAFGVSFRVGGHLLTLQGTGGTAGRWGSFQRPIPLELPTMTPPFVETRPEPAPRETESVPGSTAETARPETETEQERIARWQARQEERESRLNSRHEERRWEERWKAAGEHLRARSTTSPPRPAAPVVPKPAEPGDAASALPRDGVRVRRVTRRFTPATSPEKTTPAAPSPTPPPPPRTQHEPVSSAGWGATPLPSRNEPRASAAVARPFHQAEPPSSRVLPVSDRAPDPAPEPKTDSPESEAAFEPPPTRTGVAPRTVEAVAKPTPVHTSAGTGACPPVVSEPSPIAEVPAASSREPVAEPASLPDRFETSTNSCHPNGWVDRGPYVTDTSLGAPVAWPVPVPLDASIATVEETAGPNAGDEVKETEEESAPRSRLGFRRAKRSATRVATPAAKVKEPPRPSAPSPSLPPIASPQAPTPKPLPERSGNGVVNREWPTAREIFAAQMSRQAIQAAPRPPASSRAPSPPRPTVVEEPASWSVPLGIGLPVALAGVLVVGGVVLALTVAWSGDDQAAGIVANHLAHAAGKVKPLPESLVPPSNSTWWKSTSGHLTRWALAIDRGGREIGQAEEARALLESAVRVSPVDAAARFALSRPVTREDGVVPLVPSLGLSRDVVALAWSGRQLLASGKKDAALKVYREALEMAAESEPPSDAPLTFLDDPQVRRYALPYEDLIGPLVRDLAERTDWRFADWSSALPRFGVVPLVAARALRERSSPDADQAIDAVLASTSAPPRDGFAAAVQVAAQGEALALKARWTEAEEHYRRAIGLVPDGRTRRSWYFNVADLALHLADETKRLEALEAARGSDSRDEISERVLDLRNFKGVRSVPSGARTADTKPLGTR